MSEIAVIGEQPVVAGFALAGALVYPAGNAVEAQAAWQMLPSTVAVVILTPAAADALSEQRYMAPAPLTVVMPL